MNGWINLKTGAAQMTYLYSIIFSRGQTKDSRVESRKFRTLKTSVKFEIA